MEPDFHGRIRCLVFLAPDYDAGFPTQCPANCCHSGSATGPLYLLIVVLILAARVLRPQRCAVNPLEASGQSVSSGFVDLIYRCVLIYICLYPVFVSLLPSLLCVSLRGKNAMKGIKKRRDTKMSLGKRRDRKRRWGRG